MSSRNEGVSFLPLGAPDLRFDARDQKRLFESRGANCGPGAIAGVCGLELDAVVDALGAEFDRRRATTEIMATRALDLIGIAWRQSPPRLPDYGLARIQWDGPWVRDPDPYAALRHSHWVGVNDGGGRADIFDINAIAQGGWLRFAEWNECLRPWLLEQCEPEASGAWWVHDAYELTLPT